MLNKLTSMAALCLLLTAQPGLTNAQQRKFVEGIEQKPFLFSPRGTFHQKNTHAPYRTYDGTNNNVGINRGEYGASDIALFREIACAYGASDTKNAMGGDARPTPRWISNLLCDEPVTQFNSRNLSAMFYVWGQFIDHDITLTPAGITESVPIALPGDEVVFTEPIPFTRSEVRAGTGVTQPREQTNLTTSWIDASMVYGSDSVRATWLRKLTQGKMKTSTGNFLPWNTVTGEKSAAIDPNAPSMANDADHTAKTFVAGDVRASEHPGLLSLHTIFVREHNRICDELLAQGYTGDEEIYQIARKRVGALIQAITYQEFLPALGVTLGNYTGYKSSVRPDIMNTFATAGYRIGHTLVADELALRDNSCAEVAPGEMDLVDVFWTPQLVVDMGMEPFLKGFSTHKQYETDTKINSVLRNFLFGSPNAPVRFGIDLASLNIQRGRDHGLPDYNTVRKYYCHNKVTSFAQISSDPAIAAALQTLYGSVDNIDLWIGILSEDRMSGKSVGTTMYQILKSQFEKLRDADYYYYLYDPYLTASVRSAVVSTKLSDVISRNTTLTSLQSDLFFINPCPGENGEDRMTITTAGASAGMKVFPNPVIDGEVVIVADDTTLSCHIAFYNMSGALVKEVDALPENSKIKVDISSLVGGVYFMTLNNGIISRNCRLIKMDD